MEIGQKVKIISDSTCDLSQELTAKYDIDILPLHILLGKSAVQLDVPDAVSGRVAEAETEVIDNARAVAENNA